MRQSRPIVAVSNQRRRQELLSNVKGVYFFGVHTEHVLAIRNQKGGFQTQ